MTSSTIGTMLNRNRLLYISLPFLIALYPVLTLYQHNINELSLDSLIPIIPQILGAAGMTFVILGLIFRRLDKASYCTAFGVIYYFSYGVFDVVIAYAYLLLGFLSFLPIISYRDEARIGLLVYTLLYIVIAGILMYKRDVLKKRVHKSSLIGLIVTIVSVLNLINISVIAKKEWSIRSINSHYNYLSTHSQTDGIGARNYPDIYYLVLDRYARDDILKRDYDFSNTEFLNFLKRKDFTVLHKSRNNYPKTYVSVASSLNGKHLKDLLPEEAMKSQVQTVVYEVLEDNWFLRVLGQRDYTTYNLGGWWGPTRFNKYVDENVSLYTGSTEFLNVLLNSSVNKPLRTSVSGTEYDDSFLSYPDPSGYDNFMYQTDFLMQLAKNPDKTFVFMHGLSIHEPYIFNDGCKPGGSRYTDEYAVYLRQLECTNKRLTHVVDIILENSTDPVIIILQSDEGPITYDMSEDWFKNTEAQLQRHQRIFNAIYSTYPLSIYEGMTPVNTFRIIGNDIFGMNLEILPDRTYANPSQKKPLQFIDVTDVIEGKSTLRAIKE